MAYKTNFKLWAYCSIAVFCLFIAFESGLGGKFTPVREVLTYDLRNLNGRMPIVILLQFIFVATLLFGLPSAALGWVIQAAGIVAWSRISKRKAGVVPPPLPNKLADR